MNQYPRFHPVQVGRVIGIYDGRFLCWSIADRDHANRTNGEKYDELETAQRRADELNQEDETMNANTRLNAALSVTFAGEWERLSADDRALIVRDCTEDGGVSDLAQYRRNIGAGNLQSYVLTQRVRFGVRS